MSLLFLCVAAQDAYSQNLSTSATAGTAPAAPINYETAHLSRVATAIRINEKITLDGRFEEPAWKLALPISDFTQQHPHHRRTLAGEDRAAFPVRR